MVDVHNMGSQIYLKVYNYFQRITKQFLNKILLFVNLVFSDRMSNNGGSMLVHRLRRLTNINPTLAEHLVWLAQNRRVVYPMCS